jgi:outer membrane lipoprotein SlyB
MRNVTIVFTALAALALAGCATMNVSSHIERNVVFPST